MKTFLFLFGEQAVRGNCISIVTGKPVTNFVHGIDGVGLMWLK